MLVEMEVASLRIDSANNAPIVILKEKNGEAILPIWIGFMEASAIAFELEKIPLARPMTHDLLRDMLTVLNAKVLRVAVVDLRDNTYYATILLSRDGKTIAVDSRPSDAIALALRADAPIMVEDSVLQKAYSRSESGEATPNQSGPEEVLGVKRQPGQGEEEAMAAPKVIVTDQDTRVDEETALKLLKSLSNEDFGKYKM